MDRPFRVLALSGGGVRGIFQAAYLARLSRYHEGPLHKYFDLVCGTSTGAIVAAAIASEIEPKTIVEAYTKHSLGIFSKRIAGPLRQGGQYDASKLANLLTEIFGERTLADTKTELLITATSLDTYSHKTFTTLDGKKKPNVTELLLSDIVRASASAPTYFLPTNPKGSSRAFVDGGLWANSPTIAALLRVHLSMGIPFSSMRVLSIGNGKRPPGTTIERFSKLRALSTTTIDHVIELMFSSQESFSDEFASELVGAEAFILANASLDEEIKLDNAELALQKLPALAEKVADETSERFGDLFVSVSKSPGGNVETGGAKYSPASSWLVPRALVAAAGLTAIYPTREYYSRHRKEARTISSYVTTAKQSITMVSVNLMTGIPYEDLARTFKKKLMSSSDKSFMITISLLNPTHDFLMRALAPALKLPFNRLAGMIHDSLGQLITLKEELPSDIQPNLEIRVHGTIPFASAIILDGEAQDGRIQLETKPYAVENIKSFAIEVMRTGAEDSLYENLHEGYCRLLKDGVEVSREVHNSMSTLIPTH